MKNLILGCLLAFFTSGCSTTYYLYQAGRGQLALFNRAQPLEKVIADPHTDPDLAALLKQVPEIKRYGEQFALKPTPNYSDYVKLDQDSVVYVVTVCDPLKFEPKIFSFPIAGSFNYLGWFKEKDAREFAKTFEDQGFDVDVRGASAYSTLGWFHDPLLSSMIPTKNGRVMPSAQAALVNVVLHESVHATLYVKNQSYFNEGLASFVADVLTQKYYESKNLLSSAEWKEYDVYNRRSDQVRERMLKAFADLSAIYQSTRSNEEKRSLKREYLEGLQKEFPHLRKVSNATLVQYQTYHSSEKGFRALYEKKKSDIQAFMQSLQNLKGEDFAGPQQEQFDRLLLER